MAALALTAAPASATICPAGTNPLTDYCSSTPDYALLVAGNLPEAWYRLDDGVSATVMTDSSGNLHHGEYKNEQDSGPTGISGDGNKARDFFGQNGYGYVNGIPAPNHQSTTPYTSFTLEAWFNADDTDSVPGTHNDGTIVDFGRGPAIYLESGLIKCTYGDTTITAGSFVWQDTKWYQVVCRKSGNHLDLFINESPNLVNPPPSPAPGSPPRFLYTPAASGTSSYLPEGSPTFYIGYGAHAPWFNGAIDEVSYYTYALTDDQIALHFYADPPPADAEHAVATQPGGSSHSDNSKNAAKNPASAKVKAKQLAAAKKEVKRLTGAVAKLKRQIGAMKYHHASKKAVAKVRKQLAKYRKQLTRAKAKVKALG